MEQRRTSAPRGFSAEELAADLWDAAELEDMTPLAEWMAHQPGLIASAIIPNAAPAHLSTEAKMFDDSTVYFGKDRKQYVVCKSRKEAELIKLLANLGVHGAVHIPATPDGCVSLTDIIEERVQLAQSRFEELARTRTNLGEKQDDLVKLLLRWFILGRQIATPEAINTRSIC